MILDIHTHHPAPQPEGVISLRFSGADFQFHKTQKYSIGLHPWDSNAEVGADFWEKFESLAAAPEVVAIGEAGIDLNDKGAPMFRQLNQLKRQIEISENLQKPLIIHDVKAHDIICALRRDLKPSQAWVVHGFRGKPQLAEMLLKAGLYISLGELFNPDTALKLPADRLLAETDESPLSIREVIQKISNVRDEDTTEIIANNIKRILK